MHFRPVRQFAAAVAAATALSAAALPNFAPAVPFTPVTPSDGVPLGSATQVGDLDGDGLDDLFDANQIANIGVLQSRVRTFLKRSGVFVEGPVLDTAVGWSIERDTLHLLRVDADALPDLVFLSRGTNAGTSAPPMAVMVARGVGGGAFAPAVALAVAPAYYGTLEVVDLDGDGDPDLAYNAGLDALTSLVNDAGTFVVGPTVTL
jgi:hypothetical protein